MEDTVEFLAEAIKNLTESNRQLSDKTNDVIRTQSYERERLIIANNKCDYLEKQVAELKEELKTARSTKE